MRKLNVVLDILRQKRFKNICVYSEKIRYVFWGALTTLVNYIAYYFFVEFICMQYLYATVLAWLVAVIFAYIVNKIFVFNNVDFKLKQVLREGSAFVSSRLLSGGLEVLQMYVFVSLFSFNDKFSKVVVGIVVVIINYIFSKMILSK